VTKIVRTPIFSRANPLGGYGEGRAEEKTVLPLEATSNGMKIAKIERSTPFKELKSLCEMAMGSRVLILA
jgi:hypothetical protein